MVDSSSVVFLLKKKGGRGRVEKASVFTSKGKKGKEKKKIGIRNRKKVLKGKRVFKGK